MIKEHVSPVWVSVCSGCGHATTASPLRCHCCGGGTFDRRRHSGEGVVLASTTTATRLFVVVGLGDGVCVLAFADQSSPLRAGAVAHVHAADDGTYQIVEDGVEE